MFSKFRFSYEVTTWYIGNVTHHVTDNTVVFADNSIISYIMVVIIDINSMSVHRSCTSSSDHDEIGIR